MVPLSSAGQGARGGQPARAQPLQPAPLGHHHRQPGARLFAGRGAEVHGRDRRAHAAAGLCHRAQRRQPRVPRSSSGALGLVFVLALLFIFLVLAAQFESFIDPFVILLSVPLVDGGRAGGAAPDGRHAQRVFADRPDHAGGPDHQARHPDRRVQQPACASRAGRDGRGDRGRQPAPAPDPDDHRRHGAGRGAAGAGHRRRRREPAADRLGDRGRHERWARC
jgi:hypothetical protein